MEGMFAYVSAGTPRPRARSPSRRPAPSVLARAGLADVGTVAGNEPFAAQILAHCAEPGLDPERMNPHGGSIALGEPYDAAGARLAATVSWAPRPSRRTGFPARYAWMFSTACP